MGAHLIMPSVGIMGPKAPLAWDFSGLGSFTSVVGANTLTFARASAGSRVNSQRRIEAIGVNEARMDHRPADGGALGYLAEVAISQSIHETTDLTNAQFSQTDRTIISGAAMGPDGVAASADSLEQDIAATNIQGLHVTDIGDGQDGGVVQGLLKIPEGSTVQWVRVALDATSGSRRILQWFDIINDVIGSDAQGSGSADNKSVRIDRLADDWVWIRTAWTNGATSGDLWQISAVQGDGNSNALVDQPLYFWGLDAYPHTRRIGSHNPNTSGADLAVSADSLSGTVDFDGEGTLVVYLTTPMVSWADSRLFLDMDDGTANNLLQLRWSAAKTMVARIVGTGAAAVDATSAALSSFQDVKVAFAWSDTSNKIQISIDGATPVEAAWTDSFSTNLSRIFVGQDSGGGAQPSGWVRYIEKHDVAHLDGDLQAV